MRYLILAQSETTACALEAWLQLLGEQSLEGSRDPRVIVWSGHGHLTLTQAFEHLAKAVEELAGGQPQARNPVTVLVDHVSSHSLDIVQDGRDWDSIVAMLVLTFPEFRWVFGVCSVSEDASGYWNNVQTQHTLPTLLFDNDSAPLFDSSGLRDWIRKRTNASLENALEDDLQLPMRLDSEWAGVIDEEQAYLYFNGYCAYRFGFRADLIDTWGKMKMRFGEGTKSSDPAKPNSIYPHSYWLLLEDMSLNFPDREKGVKLHNLGTERVKHCPRLDSSCADVEASTFRVLVTTGQTRPGDNALSENRAYLRRKAVGRGAVVLKPAGGMFDLWEQAGLMRRHKTNQRPGFAPGFRWTPGAPKPVDSIAGGHGAPGKLLLVAEKLIERAEALKAQVRSVADAVLGATLATDALELTGGRTPTTAIQALSLKHQFEVLAECQFSGVEYHMRVEPRIAEITNELEAICRWFEPHKRNSALQNAQMNILNGLVRILRDHNQFDEEQICMREVRRLHTTLWMKARPWRYAFWFPIRYVEFLLSSFLGFVGIVVLWLLVLSLLFSLVPANQNQNIPLCWGIDQIIVGAERAVTSFFSIGPPMQHGSQPSDYAVSYVVLSAFTMIAGFLHLGVLVTHLYSVVSRK
mgnify:CR=1 FL=1